MPGPMPSGNARRRNAPTIAPNVLPAEGRVGDPPVCPYTLGVAGARWWAHAWGLPQATRWDDGALYLVARRASLEDDLVALEDADGAEATLAGFVAAGFEDVAKTLAWTFNRLKANASGRRTLMQECRDIEDRLGLSPKSMATLRWSVAPSESDERPSRPSRPRGEAKLRAV